MFKDAQAFQILLANSLVSRSSASSHFGYNLKEEMQQMMADMDMEFAPEPFNQPGAQANNQHPQNNDDEEEDGEENNDE